MKERCAKVIDPELKKKFDSYQARLGEVSAILPPV
jgi:hypothetical protein